MACQISHAKGGIVLDPFMGSGATGCAAALEGMDFIGIEKEEKHIETAKARIAYWSGESGKSETEQMDIADTESQEPRKDALEPGVDEGSQLELPF